MQSPLFRTTALHIHSVGCTISPIATVDRTVSYCDLLIVSSCMVHDDLCQVVQSFINANPGLTLKKTINTNQGLGLVMLQTTGPFCQILF